MEKRTDEQLMQQVKKGDGPAMKHLVDRHQMKLFGFFLRMSGDRHMAEDLVQMSFERLYRYRDNFQDEKNLVTWLFQIARNVWSTVYRNKLKRETVESNDPVATEPATDPALTADLQELIQTALLQLPERDRELVVLYQLKGFSYKELSRLFGTTEGNLRIIQYRALKKLGIILKKLGYEDI